MKTFPRRAAPTALAGSLVLLTGALGGACEPIPTLEFLGSDSGSGDGGGPNDGGGSNDSGPSPDAPGGVIPVGPITVATTGVLQAGTGLALQTHLVYAREARRWWLFYAINDNTGQSVSYLHTRSSADFVAWTEGTPLTLPTPHAGRADFFGVDYADIGGHDVVHLAIGLGTTADGGAVTRHHHHVRGVIAGSDITFGAAQEVSSATDPAPSDPDGVITHVDTDDHVYDASGWATIPGNGGTGNESVWQTATADDGTAGYTGALGQENDVYKAAFDVRSRALVSLGAGTQLALWDSADAPSLPTNVGWSLVTGGKATKSAMVFAPGSDGMHTTDWAVARLPNGEVDVVRVRASGAFDHRRYDGQTWSTPPGFGIPAQILSGDPGIVLLVRPPGMWLVAVGQDGTNLVAIPWDGTAWGNWTSYATSAPGRLQSLSGYTSDLAGGVVYWSQAATDADGAAINAIAGRILF